MEFRPELSHYECILCGVKFQILKEFQKEIYDEESGDVVDIEKYIDMDGDATVEIIMIHLEEKHPEVAR